MRTPLPPCLVPTATPATRPSPGYLPQHSTGCQGVYLTAVDTLNQGIPLNQIQRMAMGPRLPNTSKPRHPLAGRGACDPGPVDQQRPSSHRALLQLTMKPTAKLPTTPAGENLFIVEGVTDDIITLAANSLAAVTGQDVAGHPTERKDRVQEREGTLTPDLFDHWCNLPVHQNNKYKKLC